MNTMEKKYKFTSLVIIGAFSFLAAAWAAATAVVPIIGPALADTAGLTLLTVAMAYSLCVLSGQNKVANNVMSFAPVALSFITANLALKAFASLFPVFGSYYSACSTFIIQAALGWGIVKILEAGADPIGVTREDLLQIIIKQVPRAKLQREPYELLLTNLPDDAKSEIEALEKKLASFFVSKKKKKEVMDQISSIFEEHNLEYEVD